MSNTTVKAAATGRLLLGEFDSWDEFQSSIELTGNRGERRAKTSRLRGSIRQFLKSNFEGATEAKLSRMWNILNANHGLRRHLPEFQNEFFRIRENYRLDVPEHAVVDISLWGLGYDFPERQLADSLSDSVRDLRHWLDEGRKLDFNFARDRVNRNEVRSIPRRQQHYCRSVLFFSFALAECYVNGLAWEYLRSQEGSDLSARKRKELEDKTSTDPIRKLKGFDGLLYDAESLGIADAALNSIADSKAYRDAITHPSPFAYQSRRHSTREFEKLEKFYQLDESIAFETAASVKELITKIEFSRQARIPFWLEDLASLFGEDEMPFAASSYTDN